MLKFSNHKEVTTYLRLYSFKIEKTLVYALEYLVAELQNHAKLNAEYEDQTSNLKSSIGGVILKDGRPITYKGFEGKPRGVSQGTDFINSLIKSAGRGYVVILVAGMEYATYVENNYGLNVLKQSELKMFRDLPDLMSTVKQKISLLP